MHAGADRIPAAPGPVRGPQSLVSGLVLVALALFAIWLTSDLPQGTLRAMGPAMLPRWLAVGIGFCGLLLIVVALSARLAKLLGLVLLFGVPLVAYLSLPPGTRFAVVIVATIAGILALAAAFTNKDSGAPLERFGLRGPLVVGVAILCFGLTIRGYPLGPIRIPQLGLIGAGPLAIFISGFATPEARWRDLAILALALTAFCMTLFGDLLNLPIPMFPQALADLYPSGWSSDARLRTTAALLALAALAIFLATHRRRSGREPIDVVPDEHAGTI